MYLMGVVTKRIGTGGALPKKQKTFGEKAKPYGVGLGALLGLGAVGYGISQVPWSDIAYKLNNDSLSRAQVQELDNSLAQAEYCLNNQNLKGSDPNYHAFFTTGDRSCGLASGLLPNITFDEDDRTVTFSYKKGPSGVTETIPSDRFGLVVPSLYAIHGNSTDALKLIRAQSEVIGSIPLDYRVDLARMISNQGLDSELVKKNLRTTVK